jgi:hypothetical protein
LGSEAISFFTMVHQWVQRNFKLSSIGKRHLYFVKLDISWGLQISIEFLSKITQRLLRF